MGITEESLFFIDRKGATENDYEGALIRKKIELNHKEESQNTPLWHDSDDDELEVDIAHNNLLKKLRTDSKEIFVKGTEYVKRLRKQYDTIIPKPKWAIELQASKKPAIIYHNNEKNIKSSVLPEGLLSILPLKNANAANPSDAVIRTLAFHRNDNLLMVGSHDKNLNLFQINERSNPLLKTIHFSNMPITMAKFTVDGSEIVATGRRSFYYIYDIVAQTVLKIDGIPGLNRYGRTQAMNGEKKYKEERSLERFFISPDNKYIAFTGKDGYIHLVSRNTRQLITSLKMNDSVRQIDFSGDGRHLFGVGEGHEIYQWDLHQSGKCISKVMDYGGIKSSSLGVSTDGSLLACGSNSGIVNIYETNAFSRISLQQPAIKPIKSIDNLTTYVNDVRFNHDGQLLGMSTRSVKNGFRLLHVPSLSVISNWPSSKTNLNYVNAFDFSPSSRYIATGNDRGQVQLFKLSHYN